MIKLKELLEFYGFPLELIKFKYDYNYECDINLLELSYIPNLGHGIFPKNFNGFNFPLIFNDKDIGFKSECYPQFLELEVNLKKSDNLHPYKIAKIYYKNILLKNDIFSEKDIEDICTYVKVKNKLSFRRNVNKFQNINSSLEKIIKEINDFNFFIEGMNSHNIKNYSVELLSNIKKEVYRNKKILENVQM